MRLIRNLCREQRGATAVEYGLICALIVIAILAALESFAGATINLFNQVTTQVSNVE